MSVLCIQASNVSEAWLQAVRALDLRRDPRALHMVVSIDDPTTEDQPIRAAVDMLMNDIDQQGVDTVANTIFPAAIAATSASHEELVRRYLRYLPRLRQFKGNQLGTYFARLVNYPGATGPVDQLGAVIALLQKGGRARFTRYEALIDQPAPTDALAGPDGQRAVSAEVLDTDSTFLHDGPLTPIYVPGKDNSPGNFPCMSHCSFQLDADDRLHALAYYRSQSMVKKAYGNYLGLGRLLQYVADQAGLGTGQLTVVAGQAQIEMARRQIGLVLSQPDTLPGLSG